MGGGAMAFQPNDNLDDNVISATTDKMWRDMKRKEIRQKIDTPTFKLANEDYSQVRIENKLYESLKEKFLSTYGQDVFSRYVAKWCLEVTGLEICLGLYEKPALIDFYEAIKYSKDPFAEGIAVGRKK